jgi:hypothetical protein
MSRSARLLVGLIWLAGCAPADLGIPVLTIGTGGPSAFAPVVADEVLLLARGCQGSQHVPLTLEVRGVDPRAPTVELSLSRVDNGAVVSAPFLLRLALASGAGTSQVSVLLMVPDPVLDVDLVLHGLVEDSAGRRAEQQLPVRLAWGTEACGI